MHMPIPFLLRDDDLCAYATAEEIQAVYGPILDRIKVTFATVPFIDPRGNSFCTGRGTAPAALAENRELCCLLRGWINEEKIEIGLHGVTHRDDGVPEFAAQYAPQAGPAAEYLTELFGTPVVTFVPPHNTFSKSGYLSVRAAGLSILTSVPFNLATRPLRDLSLTAFLRRRAYLVRSGAGARYPFPIVVNGHAELSCYAFLKAHGIDDLCRALSFVNKANGYFAIASHWWELRDNPHLKQALIDFLDQNAALLRPVLAQEVWQSALNRSNDFQLGACSR